MPLDGSRPIVRWVDGEVADQQLTEAEERATYYTARSVPVDSAALYEAVNRYVDALTEGRYRVRTRNFEGLDQIQDQIEYAERLLLSAASALADHRSERRAQQTETGQ